MQLLKGHVNPKMIQFCSYDKNVYQKYFINLLSFFSIQAHFDARNHL